MSESFDLINFNRQLGSVASICTCFGMRMWRSDSSHDPAVGVN